MVVTVKIMKKTFFDISVLRSWASAHGWTNLLLHSKFSYSYWWHACVCISNYMYVCSGMSEFLVFQPKRDCCNAVMLNLFICSVFHFWTSFAHYSNPDRLILVCSNRSRYASSMNIFMLTGGRTEQCHLQIVDERNINSIRSSGTAGRRNHIAVDYSRLIPQSFRYRYL